MNSFIYAYLVLQHIGRMLAADVRQQTLPLGYYKRAHIDQTNHTAFQPSLSARTFAQTPSGASAGDSAVGLAEHDDVLAVIVDHGKQPLVDRRCIFPTIRTRDVLGIETGMVDRDGWISGFVDEAEEDRVSGGRVPGTGNQDECRLREHLSKREDDARRI